MALQPLAFASWHTGSSSDRAQMCVVSFVTAGESTPPSAAVAPMMPSLSNVGSPAQVRVTEENIIRGSGEKGRMGAGRLLARHSCTQFSVTTGIIMAWASVYCGKSIVLDTMWLTSSTGIEPLSRGSQISPPLFCMTLESCRVLELGSRNWNIGRGWLFQGWYHLGDPLGGQLGTGDEGQGALRKELLAHVGG